jgi:hypothetical protein
MKVSSDTVDRVRSLVRDGNDYEDICSELCLSTEEVVSSAFTKVKGSDSNALDSSKYQPWKNQHVLIELYCEHNLRFTEISEILDCHPETVKLWISRLANPRIVRLTVEVGDDFSVDVYTDSGKFSTSLIGFGSDFFDDENITPKESDNEDVHITVGMIHSSGTTVLEDSAPTLESDDSEWVVFPTGYEFAGEKVVRNSITGVRDLLQ